MLGSDEAVIPSVLDRVGLGREGNARVRGFSAGMQRRLALARLIMGHPGLLLLDEPYNNFDPQGIELVNEVIRDARERGGAALVVLHDLRQGEQTLDRIITLSRGALLVPEASRAEAAPAVRLAAGGV